MQERIDADKGAPPVGPYSPAVRANGLIFTSGQIPLNPETGEIVGDSIQDQVRQTLENLKILLEAAGSSLDHREQRCKRASAGPCAVPTTAWQCDRLRWRFARQVS